MQRNVSQHTIQKLITAMFIEEVFITDITLDQSRYKAIGEQIKRWDACTLCS